MNFNFQESIELLEKTPQTLYYFLSNLSPTWLQSNEGEETWNPKQVMEHLVEGEKTNWIPRMEAILDPEIDQNFTPFNRFSHLNQKERTIEESLEEFKTLRADNLKRLQNLIKSDTDLDQIGIHPEFGPVTLKQLISTWVVHDLTHIAQIVRVMAKRYKDDVGPWISYLGILQR